MKVHPRLMSLLLACGSWLAAPPAHAVISCTVSSPGFTSIYDTATGTPNDNVGTSLTLSLPYYPRIAAGLNPPAGLYTDTVTMTLTYGSATAQSTFPVQIYVNTSCQINSPTDLTFNYSSFRVTALTATSTFNVKCTNALPYALSLDLTSVTDAAINLAYTLALSATSGTGTGANQAVTVTGTMAAGQSGTCATAVCTNAASANKQRTVTVTF